MERPFNTLAGAIKHWADVDPGRDAIVFLDKKSRTYTFTSRDVYVMAGRFASRLHHSGFQAGDVIGNTLFNSPERLVTDCGILMGRCVTLNIVTVEADGRDFWLTASKSKCRGIIARKCDNCPVYSLLHPYIADKRPEIYGAREVNIPHLPCLKKVFLIERLEGPTSFMSPSITQVQDPTGATTVTSPPGQNLTGNQRHFKDSMTNVSPEYLMDSISQSDEEVVAMNNDPLDEAIVFLTSGTSGYSKLIPRNHKELIDICLMSGEFPIKRYYNNRHMGWLGGFLADYLGHGTTRLMQDMFDGSSYKYDQEFWDHLHREQVDGVNLFPHEILELAEMFKGQVTNRIPVAITGGQPIPKTVVSAGLQLSMALAISYGTTESAFVSTAMLLSAEGYEDFNSGRPMKSIQVKIVDQHGRQLPQGEQGDVYVKSPYMLRGYHNGKPASSILTSDGFLHTGDVGYIGDDGDLFVIGRDDTSFLQDRRIIYLSWPEQVLARCPEVRDVIVVKIKDIHGTDKICACVIPCRKSGLTESDLLEFYEDNFFKSHESAKAYTFPALQGILFFRDTFPLTFNGKPDRRKLQKLATERFSVGQMKSKY